MKVFKTEAELEKACVEYAEGQGVLCYKFVSPGKTGVPDHIFIFPGSGETVYVEFKHPNGLESLDPLQIVRRDDISGQGAAVYACDDFDAFKWIMSEHAFSWSPGPRASSINNE